MQKWILAIALLASGITTNAQSYEELARDYVSRFKDLAIQEQKRSGVPASITLAQGIHETSAGKSELATNANNHFGIKCKKNWTGETYSYTDDAPDECFRKYSSAEQSYFDHSDYLSKTPRYAVLFTYAPTDYTSWAHGLKKCGYATNPRYAQILINLVEEYKLQEYTYAAINGKTANDVAMQGRENEIVPVQDAPATPPTPVTAAVAVPVATATATDVAETASAKRKSRIVVQENAVAAEAGQPEFPPYGEVVHVNGLKAIYAKKGDMPLEYALKTDVRYEKLLEINDISDKPLPEDMYLYLERKHMKGIRPVHIVKEGETIEQVARFEGMNVKSIRSLNQLETNEEPVAGTVLQLQSNAPVKPQIIAKTAPAMPPVAAEAPTPLTATIEATPVPPTVTEPPAAEPATPVAPANIDNTVATTPPAEAQQPTPVEENTLAGNIAAEPAVIAPPPPPTPTQEEQPAVAQVATAVPADVPAPPASTEPAPPNPPSAINIANEKPIEEVIAEEKKNQAAALPEPPKPPTTQPEEPKDELDALKARFDKVVYAKRNTTPATPAPETKTAETPVAVAPAPEAKPADAPVATAPATEVKAEPAPQQAVTASTGPKFYVVKKGDTAFGIAKRNNITMRQLMDWNNLDFEAIKVGQRLKVQP